MQVSLDPVRWPPIDQFSSFDELDEWIESKDSQGGLARGSYQWPSDSAIAYFHIAEALEALARAAPALGPALERGYRRLIAENGHPDELGTAKLGGGSYWISIRPESVGEILEAIRQTDAGVLHEELVRRDIGIDLTQWGLERKDFVEFLEQHKKVVEVAAEHGLGLLGHCG